MSGLQPIGIFDSGYGGLTIMRDIVERLPGYDYIYLGDNARAPYGSRSFETVYRYTWEAVRWFFDQGCPLVILACNTASAKALRTIQQHDLPLSPDPHRRVLGVIRPSTEVIGRFSKTREVGILATRGTVSSMSYPIEIAKFFPDIRVYQQACPMWVPLVEANEFDTAGADFFVEKCLNQLLNMSAGIDTILLACTHYPILIPRIRKFLQPSLQLVSQGDIVARSLEDYLQRHPALEERISRGSPAGQRRFYTTDSTEDFDNHAGIFYGSALQSVNIDLPHPA